MSMTKYDLIEALKDVPANAILIADLGGGESRCVESVEFVSTHLPDTRYPQLVFHAPEV